MTSAFPEPKRSYRDGDSFSTRILSWLNSVALEELYRLYKASQPLPSLDDLDLWLYECAVDAGHAYLADDYDLQGKKHKGRITYVELGDLCRKAATYSLEVNDPAAVEARARRGGQRSKRPPQYDYRLLEACEGLSIAETAQKLGLSPATVSRLRKRALKAAELTPADRLGFTTGDHELDRMLDELTQENVDQRFQEMTGALQMAGA